MSTISVEKVIPKRAPKPEKIAQVETLSDLLDRSAGVVLTDYRGFTVAEKAELTRRLRDANAEYHVVKNTLFRLAYAERGENPESLLAGPTAVAFALDDPVAPSKVISDFIREKKKGTVKGAIVDGRVFDAAGAEQLSKLPPKLQLLAQVAGTLQSPMSSMAYCLQGVLGNMARVLQAVHEQKSGAGA
ncbi:MAG: ribosomal protein [Armatimonadetes bacterium]|nr:ribosomal protein [Armatimonadota bacterium]